MARKNYSIVAFSTLELDHMERAMIIDRSASKAEFIRKAVYKMIERLLGSENESITLNPGGYKAATKKRVSRISHAQLRERIWNRKYNTED